MRDSPSPLTLTLDPYLDRAFASDFPLLLDQSPIYTLSALR